MGWRMWTAAILAGGQARRLGGLDKSALAVGALTVLQRQLAALDALTPHILIVGRERLDGEPRLRTVPDRIAAAGALGGIYTALLEAPTDLVLVIACDMPFLTAAFLELLAVRAETEPDADAIVPRDDRGRHPLCAAYRRRAAAAFKTRIDAGELRVLDALGAVAVREIGPDEIAAHDHDGRLLLNVNTPDDYARAQQR
jgi:molybdopterin-guanine dinucleotide biosynthesis protein A